MVRKVEERGLEGSEAEQAAEVDVAALPGLGFDGFVGQQLLEDDVEQEHAVDGLHAIGRAALQLLDELVRDVEAVVRLLELVEQHLAFGLEAAAGHRRLSGVLQCVVGRVPGVQVLLLGVGDQGIEQQGGHEALRSGRGTSVQRLYLSIIANFLCFVKFIPDKVTIAQISASGYNLAKSAANMHIQVSDILARDTGYRTGFKIAGERPVYEDVTLLDDVQGDINLMRTEDGLLSSGAIQTSIELECHRCLSTFAYSIKASLSGEFVAQPTAEQWPIAEDQTIDIAPLIRQELIVSTPIKQLCKADCTGIEE